MGRDQHALHLLPGQTVAFEAEVANLHERLSDPDFFRRDPAGFARPSEAPTAAEADLAAMEERWLELELLREAMQA